MSADEPSPTTAPQRPRPPTIVDRIAPRARIGEIGRPSRAGVFLVRFVIAPCVRLFFRPRLTGAESLPAGPCLLVANHSGGGTVDVLAFVTLWFAQFGTSRPTTGLAHPLVFFVPGAAWVVRSFGAVPSTYAHALAAFAKGVTVLVYPGGDHEGFRPIWQAKRVDWNGRQGFLRLAREAWVPVVPVGYQGTHFTAPVLWRSRALPWLLVVPRALGIKRLPVTLVSLVGLALILWFLPATHGWPTTLALAYLWTLCPISWFLPTIPWSVKMHLGQPISPEELFGSRGSTGPLDESAERVRAAVEALVRAQL